MSIWSGIGSALGSLLSSIVGSILGFFKRKKLEKEASRGRAAKEFMKTEDAAEKEEKKQKDLQDDIKERGTDLDSNDLFSRD